MLALTIPLFTVSERIKKASAASSAVFKVCFSRSLVGGRPLRNSSINPSPIFMASGDDFFHPLYYDNLSLLSDRVMSELSLEAVQRKARDRPREGTPRTSLQSGEAVLVDGRS